MLLQAHNSLRPEDSETAINTQVSSAGQYSEEALKALRQNAIHTNKVLMEIEKPKVATHVETKGPVRDYAMDFSVDDLPEDLAHSHEAQMASTRKIPGLAEHGGRGKHIPDEAMIKHAKEKRERLRQGTEFGEDEGSFIPLKAGDASQEDRSKWGESRLITEDQDDGEEHTFEDAMGERIGFGDPQERERQAARKRREAMEQHGAEDCDSEEGDEQFEWELEKIRQGTGKRDDNEEATARQTQRQRRKGSPQEAAEVSPTSLEAVQKEMRKALLSLQNMHDSHVREVTGMETELAITKANIEMAEKKQTDASKRYELFQGTREYMLDLLDCLDKKIPQIEEAEYMISEQRVQRGKARLRRQGNFLQNLKDQVELLKGAKQTTDENNMDTFARDKLQRHTQEGYCCREARKALREATNDARPDGWSSDGESDSEVVAFQSKSEEALQAAQQCFEDVDEKFGSIRPIKERFMRWKTEQTQSYNEAFVSQSLPHVFSPYVRLELLKWKPLECPEVDKDMVWFDELKDYGEIEGGMHDGDEDENLVPNVVMDAAVPIAQEAVNNDWDALSTMQTKQVIRLWKELTSFCEASNGEMKELLRIIKDKLIETANTCFLPSLPSPNVELQMLGEQLFQRCCKLIHNIGLFDGIIVAQALQHLTFTLVVDRMLLPHIEETKPVNMNTAAKKAQTLLNCLPQSWLADPPKVAYAMIKMIQSLPADRADAADADGWNWELVRKMDAKSVLRLDR